MSLQHRDVRVQSFVIILKLNVSISEWDHLHNEITKFPVYNIEI